MQLLEYGAAVDAVDAAKGRTALHRAIKGSVMMYPLDAKVVTLLLESGASPFSADNKGESAHPAACQSNMKALMSTLMSLSLCNRENCWHSL